MTLSLKVFFLFQIQGNVHAPDNWVNVLLMAPGLVKGKTSICPAYKPLSKVSLNLHPEEGNNGNEMATRMSCED